MKWPTLLVSLTVAVLVVALVVTAGMSWVKDNQTKQKLESSEDVLRVAQDHFRETTEPAIAFAEQIRLRTPALVTAAVDGKAMTHEDFLLMASHFAMDGDIAGVRAVAAAESAYVLRETIRGNRAAWVVTSLDVRDAQVDVVAGGKPRLTYRLERINDSWKVTSWTGL